MGAEQINQTELARTIEMLDSLILADGKVSFATTMEGADQIVAHYEGIGYTISKEEDQTVITPN